MEITFIELLIVFVISYLVTYFITPIIKNIGNHLGFYDMPNYRKRHAKPIVRLGGLAITLSFFFVLLFLNFYDKNLNFFDWYKTFPLFLGISIMFLVGLVDDIFNLSPWPRLVIQFVVSIMLWSGGVSIDNLNLNLSSNNNNSIELSDTFSLIITSLWLAGFTNALNWIDGVDGLAGGLTAICLLGNILIAFFNGNYFILIISVILIGCVFGFLRFNRKPAQILMGDGGSYFLGYTLASISILNYSFNNSYSFFVPILFFFIPLLDMIFVIFKRLSNAKSLIKPDRAHIHHRLLDSGFSDTQTTNFLFLVNLITLIIGISIFFNKINIIIASVPIFVLLFFVKTNKNRIKK